jgi:hypothetical protein
MNQALSRWLFAATLAFFVAPLVSAPHAAEAAKGALWETTSQPSMEGIPMQMPATTVKACAAKDSKEPPGASTSQRNCQSSNFSKSGDKVTWDVACSNPTMKGTGEIVYTGTDAYSGSIRLKSDEAAMTIKLTGRKIGECDNPK